jgi:hypothetical protein
MRLFHRTGKTWNKVLYQHTMYVIRLSNISIKTNFKQITRVELKLTNLYNTLRRTTFCIMSRYLLPFIHQRYCSRSLSVSLYNRPTICFFEEIWTVQLQEILKLCPWKWKYDSEFVIYTINEWSLNSCFVYVAYIDMFSPTVQWYDVMTK